MQKNLCLNIRDKTFVCIICVLKRIIDISNKGVYNKTYFWKGSQKSETLNCVYLHIRELHHIFSRADAEQDWMLIKFKTKAGALVFECHQLISLFNKHFASEVNTQ